MPLKTGFKSLKIVIAKKVWINELEKKVFYTRYVCLIHKQSTVVSVSESIELNDSHNNIVLLFIES